MKKIIIIFIITAVFTISIFCGIYFANNNQSQIEEEINKEEPDIQEETYIIKSGEIQTEGIYELTSNMIKQQDVNLYYKIITNKEEYSIYKDKMQLPDMTDEDFEENFIIILNNENPRATDETDLKIYKAYSNEETTYIVMKQKDNPTDYLYYNVYYAIIDKSKLKDNVTIEIEK